MPFPQLFPNSLANSSLSGAFLQGSRGPKEIWNTSISTNLNSNKSKKFKDFPKSKRKSNLRLKVNKTHIFWVAIGQYIDFPNKSSFRVDFVEELGKLIGLLLNIFLISPSELTSVLKNVPYVPLAALSSEAGISRYLNSLKTHGITQLAHMRRSNNWFSLQLNCEGPVHDYSS